MRRASFIFPLLALLLVTGCATAVMSGRASGDNDWQASAADSRITREVRTRLYRDELLGDARIRVSTRQAVVTLRGEVGSAAAMNRAMVIANGVDGVERVDVELRVNETP